MHNAPATGPQRNAVARSPLSIDLITLNRMQRALQDIVLIVLSAGGLVLSATTLVPSWRRLARHARRARRSMTPSPMRSTSAATEY